LSEKTHYTHKKAEAAQGKCLCFFVVLQVVFLKFGDFFDSDTALGGECQKSGFVFRKSVITV